MMNRRHFIKNTIATSALCSIPVGLQSCQSNHPTHLTILHTNDVHSHVEAFKSTHPNYPNVGGIVNRAALIENIRRENPNTLLLDAGDIFQGTPYFNYFGGEVEFKLMSKLKYDAATIGNHDFDNGIAGLEQQLKHAQFEFLIANYDFSNTIMDGHTKPYKIFVKNGIKVGVFGLGIKLAGLVDPVLFKETEYLDPVEIAQDVASTLKQEEQCDLVVCLSHLGYHYKNEAKISDLKLAKQSKNIDLIIGGHTHTFLKKPTIVKNANGKNMLVNQVGKWGINLGRIDYYFDSEKNISSKGTSIIV